MNIKEESGFFKKDENYPPFTMSNFVAMRDADKTIELTKYESSQPLDKVLYRYFTFPESLGNYIKLKNPTLTIGEYTFDNQGYAQVPITLTFPDNSTSSTTYTVKKQIIDLDKGVYSDSALDTGLTMSKDYVFYVRFRCNNAALPIGASQNTSNRATVRLLYNNKKFQYAYPNLNEINFLSNFDVNGDIILKYDSRNLWVGNYYLDEYISSNPNWKESHEDLLYFTDNIAQGSNVFSQIEQTITEGAANIYIFGETSGSTSNYPGTQLQELSIFSKSQNKVIKHYVPHIDEESGKICLLETIENVKLFQNYGNGLTGYNV